MGKRNWKNYTEVTIGGHKKGRESDFSDYQMDNKWSNVSYLLNKESQLNTLKNEFELYFKRILDPRIRGPQFKFNRSRFDFTNSN